MVPQLLQEGEVVVLKCSGEVQISPSPKKKMSVCSNRRNKFTSKPVVKEHLDTNHR